METRRPVNYGWGAVPNLDRNPEMQSLGCTLPNIFYIYSSAGVSEGGKRDQVLLSLILLLLT